MKWPWQRPGAADEPADDPLRRLALGKSATWDDYSPAYKKFMMSAPKGPATPTMQVSDLKETARRIFPDSPAVYLQGAPASITVASVSSGLISTTSLPAAGRLHFQAWLDTSQLAEAIHRIDQEERVTFSPTPEGFAVGESVMPQLELYVFAPVPGMDLAPIHPRRWGRSLSRGSDATEVGYPLSTEQKKELSIEASTADRLPQPHRVGKAWITGERLILEMLTEPHHDEWCILSLSHAPKVNDETTIAEVSLSELLRSIEDMEWVDRVQSSWLVPPPQANGSVQVRATGSGRIEIAVRSLSPQVLEVECPPYANLVQWLCLCSAGNLQAAVAVETLPQGVKIGGYQLDAG